MSYKLYRSTTLGETLEDALDELITSQQISPELGMKVLQQFDQSISTALATKNKTRYSFKGHLKVYRFCDNVWTCVVEDAEVRDPHATETIFSRKLKIVACEASSGSRQ